MKTSVITKKPTGLQKAGYPVFITKRIIKEALNNSPMNYQSTKKISAILSCSSFSMAYRPLKMATHPCVAETLAIRVSLVNRVQAVFNYSKIGRFCAGFRTKTAGKCNLAVIRGQTLLAKKIVEKLFYVQVSGDSVVCAGVP
jgi:hypothetical protein